METLENISERIRTVLERRTKMRDSALAQARQLTTHASMAIRAIHRGDDAIARQHLSEGRSLAQALKQELAADLELFYAGYTQDALKEYVEACITVAFIKNEPLPTPEALDVECATYLNGLVESLGELRRRCMDILRLGYAEEVERLLTIMDDVFTELVTMDFPDAITDGLRRRTDLARGIIERTRADITISYRQSQLETSIKRLSKQLDDA